MRKPITCLTCSQDQFESLHEAVDKTRSTAATVKLPKAAIVALLMDHAKLVDMAEQLQ